VGHLNPSRMEPGEMARIAGRPGFRLVVVGSPDTPQEPELIRRLEEAGALVLREFVPRIASIYGAADVYLFPTRNPRSCIGIPLSVLEALACGLPVVSTPFQGLPRLFPDTPFVRFAVTSPEIEAALAEAPAARQAGARALVEPLDWAQVALEVSRLLRDLA
jgi:glycosyltransferase involved in cell wall biosynthesis